MKENKMFKVYSAAVLYSVFTGLSFLFGKIGLDYSGPLNLLAYRFTVAFIAFSIPAIFKWIKIDINKNMIKRLLPLAAFYPLSFFGFQAFGLQVSQSSEAGIIQAVGPIFIMVLASYFLNEKTTGLQKISIFLSVFGVIYITYKKSTSVEITNMKGIILLLISVLSFAIYSVMVRKLTREFSSLEISYVMISIGFIGFNILAIGKNLIAGDISSFFVPLRQTNFIIAILYLGVLSSSLTSFLSNYVLSKIESSKMSVFISLSTVISIIGGVIFLNEDIFYYHIIGSVLIIAGVIGANVFGEKALDDSA